MESVEIKEDNNKKQNNDGHEEEEMDTMKNNPMGNKRRKKLDLDKIGETIVGLKTYEVTVTEQQIMRYMDYTESHKE